MIDVLVTLLEAAYLATIVAITVAMTVLGLVECWAVATEDRRGR